MLSENLVMLRNLKGLTQEQVAEVVEISRQSYAKWEQGVSHSKRYHTKYDEPTLIHYQL